MLSQKQQPIPLVASDGLTNIYNSITKYNTTVQISLVEK